jgi:6-phosphofructokinase 1
MTSNEVNCLVGQSGGPTTAINASLCGVISAALSNDKINKVFGTVNGIRGVLEDKILPLHEIFKDEASLDLLKVTPSTYLGSCRYKLPTVEQDKAQYEFIFDFFTKNNIKYFFYIGGNDSMDTVSKLSQYAQEHNYDINMIGIPKTIDNDLVGTDHTPGFGSAAKYVATSLIEIAHDAYCYDIPSVTIVEIMGRNAGWLTAAAALARNSYLESPDLIYLPEVAFSIDKFVSDIKKVQEKKKNVIVAVSEGIRDRDGNYISASQSVNDSFGHAQLSGTGKRLEHALNNTIGCKVRSVELNVLQRSAAHSASLTDITEAYMVGQKAVEKAIAGETGKMIAINRTQNTPYSVQLDTIAISDVANKEKVIPREWITDEGNDILQPLIDYMLPLIHGEVSITYTNGLPKYFPISHLTKKY